MKSEPGRGLDPQSCCCWTRQRLLGRGQACGLWAPALGLVSRAVSGGPWSQDGSFGSTSPGGAVVSPVRPVARRPLCTARRRPCSLRPGSGPTPHAPGSSPRPRGWGAVLLWAPTAATCFPRTESGHLRPPLLPRAGGALSRTQGGQRPRLLCSRREVNAHSSVSFEGRLLSNQNHHAPQSTAYNHT